MNRIQVQSKNWKLRTCEKVDGKGWERKRKPARDKGRKSDRLIEKDQGERAIKTLLDWKGKNWKL